MTQPEKPHPTMPETQPAIRVTALPGDANAYGDIFGGRLMGQMDLAVAFLGSPRVMRAAGV